jgi:hypothetical protein
LFYEKFYVDLSKQTVTAFTGEKPELTTPCAGGAKGTEAPADEFRTFHNGLI